MTESYEVVRPKPQSSGPALPLIFGVFLIIAVIFYFFNDEDQASNSINEQVKPTSLELSDQNPDSLQDQFDELIVKHQSVIKELEKAHNEALEASSAATLRLEGDVSDLIDEVQTLKNELEVKRSVTEMMAEQTTALMGKIPSQTPNEKPQAKPRKAKLYMKRRLNLRL